MSTLKISDFKRVYPLLWNKINEIRISNGNKSIDADYPSDHQIPIKMYDASLAEGFLSKNVPIDYYNPKEIIGYTTLQKILNAVISEPNMTHWIKILYASDKSFNENNNNPKISKKEPKMAKVRNKVDGEIILTVTSVAGADGSVEFKATDSNGTDRTTEVNQKKLKYAFLNKGVVRGRADANGNMVWRVVKEKYIVKETNDSVTSEPTAQPSVSA